VTGKALHTVVLPWNGTTNSGQWIYLCLEIKAALHKYQHPAPSRPEHAPHTWNTTIYGAKTQFMTEATSSPTLADKEINKL
jgi:hypothetical protein